MRGSAGAVLDSQGVAFAWPSRGLRVQRRELARHGKGSVHAGLLRGSHYIPHGLVGASANVPSGAAQWPQLTSVNIQLTSS